MSPDRPRPGSAGARAVGIDLAGALGLTGTLLAYLSLSVAAPDGGRDRLRGAVLAVPRGGRDHRRHRPRARRGSAGAPPGRSGSARATSSSSLTWLLAAMYGACRTSSRTSASSSRPMDALFEAMSGFTTTGATVVTDVDALDRSILIWRQFSQWLGGMGIIVLALAVLPRLRIGGRQLFESELPGPGGEPARRADPRHGAQALDPLHRASRSSLVAALLVVGVGRAGRPAERRSTRSAMRSRRCRPEGSPPTTARSSRSRRSRSGSWRAFMVLAGVNFALLYRTFVRRDAAAALAGTRRLGSMARSCCSARSSSSPSSSMRTVSRAATAVRQAFFQTISLMTTTGLLDHGLRRPGRRSP